MALEELLAALEAEAATEAARAAAQTREEAAGIVEAARVEARAIEEDAARADEDGLVLEAERRRAQARVAAAAALRNAREECFGLLLAEIHARAAALRSSALYRSLVRSLVKESLAALPTATALRVDPRDEVLVAQVVAELGRELEVHAELETLGGVEVSDDDGRTVRNTLEERLANAEPALRILFGELWADGSRVAPEPRCEATPEVPQ